MKKIRNLMAGRENELESLMNSLSKTLEGKGTFILISGEAGIGKTRLCQEFEIMASSIGCKTLVGRCMPGPPLPFLPVIDAFKDASNSDQNTFDGNTPLVIESVRLTYRSNDEHADTRSENERFVFSILDRLRLLSSKSPVLLIIEDLHWVDSSTLQLLLFLARNLSEMRLIIVGTYRPEDLVSVDDTPHPLVDWIPTLKKSAPCKEIELKSLSEKEIAMAISSTFGISVENKLTSRITKESGGNPLFALELVRYLSETDAFQYVNGTWFLGTGASFDVPSNIRDLIIRRVERLPKEQRRILELASVVRGPFTPSILEDIISAPRGSMARAISEIAHRQLMLSESQEFFRFSHEQIRRVTYEQVSEMRRKELHHLVGKHLEALPERDFRYGELALHFDLAGQQKKALRYSLLAGEECLRRMAMMESIPFFEKVIKGTKENETHVKCRIRALEGIGTAQLELSNYDSAARHFRELLTLNPDSRTKARSLRKCAECYGPTRLGKGSSADLLRLCEEAESIPEIERSEVGEIWHYRAMVTTWEGRPEDAEKFAIESEKIFREVGPIERLAIQLTYNLTIDITIGNVGIAIEKAREIWDLYREHPYPSGELELLNYLGIALMHQGRYSEARVTIQRSIDLAEKLGDYPLVCWGYIYLAMVYEGMGQMGAASDLAQEARERALLTESPYLVAASNAALARHLIGEGRIEDAKPLVNEAKEITKEFQWAIKTPTRGLIELATAQLYDSENKDPDTLFENAQSYLQGAAFALYLEGNAFLLHGLSLKHRGHFEEGEERCRTALGIFTKIGNEEKVAKINEILEQ